MSYIKKKKIYGIITIILVFLCIVFFISSIILKDGAFGIQNTRETFEIFSYISLSLILFTLGKNIYYSEKEKPLN